MNKFNIMDCIILEYNQSPRYEVRSSDLLNTRLQGLFFLTIARLANENNFKFININFRETEKGPVVLELYNKYSIYQFGDMQPITLNNAKLYELSNKHTFSHEQNDLEYIQSIICEVIQMTNDVSTKELINHIKKTTPWDYENKNHDSISFTSLASFCSFNKNIERLFNFKRENKIEK